MQLKEANFLANGGRVGYVGGGPATTQDYATALSKVGAGTQEQKNRQVQDYARSEASSQIANALQGGQSSLDSYLTNVFGQGTPATTSGKYASYNSPFTGIFSSTRNQMIDDVAQQLVQKQAPSFYVDPKASASEAYGKMMQQKIEEAYGTPDKYRAEAMTLGMPVEAYYDYLTTRDDKNIMQQYRKQDPYFDPSTYVPFTEADRTSSPYDIYLQQVLQQQIDAGIPEEGRIQSGEVALPSMISPTTTGAAPRPFMSYSDALAQTRQSLGLADGGRVGYQVGGVATPEQYAAALAKVSAGTQDQQNRSLAEYVQNSLGLTQKHFDTVNQMKQNPKQFGINSQFDYAKKSGADLVKNANPFTQPFVALGQGVASPIYDYGQALKKYSDKGYQGEFGLSTQGILDFGKNLLRVGQEFAEQKPIQMALGRTLGGAEAIREGISSLFTNPSQQATTSSSVNQPKYPDYKTTALQSQYYKNNPSNLDFDLFRAAYAKASSTPDSQIKTDITDEGQIVTHFGNWDPSRTYAAYMSNTGTSNSNPFFDQFKGSQYSNMPTVMEAMYGTPGNMNPYYANGGSVGVGSMFVSKR
jgi:hypothetical protein